MTAPQHQYVTRILIAESQAVIRSGARLAIEEQPDMHVAAEAIDAHSAFEAARTVNPDVAVVEFGLPGGGSLDTVRRFLEYPGLALVLISASDDPNALAGAASEGARAILPKNAPMANLIEAIRGVRQDRDWTPAHLEARLEDPPDDSTAELDADWARLTPRERDVADLVKQGMPYREVARKLRISDHTVKNHLRRIFDKLDINSRVELVVHGVADRS